MKKSKKKKEKLEMNKEQEFLIENNFNDVVTNPSEKNHRKWIYVSDILRKFRPLPENLIQKCQGSKIMLKIHIDRRSE